MRIWCINEFPEFLEEVPPPTHGMYNITLQYLQDYEYLIWNANHIDITLCTEEKPTETLSRTAFLVGEAEAASVDFKLRLYLAGSYNLC